MRSMHSIVPHIFRSLPSATLGVVLLGASSLSMAQTAPAVPAPAGSVSPLSHPLAVNKAHSQHESTPLTDAKQSYPSSSPSKQHHGSTSGMKLKMGLKDRSGRHQKPMAMSHDMKCMSGDHGKGKSEAPPVGSLPRSDGAAPGDYASYGVKLKLDDDPLLAKIQLDNLETAHSSQGSNAQQWDGRFWIGRDLNKLWIRSEGSRSQGRIEEGNVEALWGHAISPFWDGMVGVRHDIGIGPTRNWIALGIQGIAPYKFEFEATVYAGPSGRSAFRLKTSQDWLFSQRLILTPEFEFNAYGRADPQRDLGAGLADASLSLRLRYEFSRKFAPYIGYSWVRSLGGTARMARAVGKPVSDRLILAGVRVWF